MDRPGQKRKEMKEERDEVRRLWETWKVLRAVNDSSVNSFVWPGEPSRSTRALQTESVPVQEQAGSRYGGSLLLL